MSSKRNAILKYLQTMLAGLDGYELSRVHIKPIKPEAIGDLPHIVIVQIHDQPTTIDAGETQRRVTVLVGVAAKIDAAEKELTPDEQMNDIYDVVHQAMESIKHGVSGVMLSCEEDKSGAVFDQIDGQVRLRFVSCYWHITYTRPLGEAVTPPEDP